MSTKEFILYQFAPKIGARPANHTFAYLHKYSQPSTQAAAPLHQRYGAHCPSGDIFNSVQVPSGAFATYKTP
jgi:hypothetical protein